MWCGHIPPVPLHNFITIKSMSVRLGGLIVRQKMFPLTSATGSDDVIDAEITSGLPNGGALGSAILISWFSPKLLESTEIKRLSSISHHGHFAKVNSTYPSRRFSSIL